jgi:hypothetical protein
MECSEETKLSGLALLNAQSKPEVMRVANVSDQKPVKARCLGAGFNGFSSIDCTFITGAVTCGSFAGGPK